jgi:hypothetical protein
MSERKVSEINKRKNLGLYEIFTQALLHWMNFDKKFSLLIQIHPKFGCIRKVDEFRQNLLYCWLPIKRKTTHKFILAMIVGSTLQ